MNKLLTILVNFIAGPNSLFDPERIHKIELRESGALQGIVGYVDREGHIFVDKAALKWEYIDVKAFDCDDNLIWVWTKYSNENGRLFKFDKELA